MKFGEHKLVAACNLLIMNMNFERNHLGKMNNTSNTFHISYLQMKM